MAYTIPDPRLVPKVWAKELWKDIPAERYWNKFMGGQNAPITVVRDIKGKNKGDSVTIPLLYKLEGPGVKGCEKLVGNEEAMNEDAMTVTVDMLRHGVRWPCERDTWWHLYDMRMKAKEYFRVWWGERDDKEIFDTLGTNPSSLRLLGDGTSSLVLDTIVQAKLLAKMARPKIRPIRIEGAEHYVLVMHPYVAAELRLSAEWKSIQSSANVRGNSNPIFSGALGVYDGVILHEHEFVKTEGDIEGAGGTANNLFFGQQAGVWVESKDVFWREDHTVDYGNEIGIATGMIYGFQKAKFETGYKDQGPQDYGLITIKTKCQRPQ